MMNFKTLLAGAFLAAVPFAAATLAVPQDEGLRAAHSNSQKAQVDERTVEYYQPNKAAAYELANALQSLHRVMRMTSGPNGMMPPEPPRFETFGGTLLVEGSKAGMPELLALIERIDAAYISEGQQEEQKLEAIQYQVRHVPLDSLYTALIPFDHSRRPEGQKGAANISYIEDRGTILFRGTREETTEVRQILESLDQPRPQVLITCYLVAGCSENEADNMVPADLARDLSALVPYAGFRLMSTGILPSDTAGKMQLQVELKDGAGEFELEMRPQAFDRATGKLTLGQVEFQMYVNQANGRLRRSFSTSTSIVRDQYAVLGAVGADPVFVVLKMSVIR